MRQKPPYVGRGSRRGIIVRGLFVAIALVGTAIDASAQEVPAVACPMWITESVTLSEDLTCAGTALTIVAQVPVTVDLGGHTVRSEFELPESCTSIYCATIVNGSGASVQNGRVAVTGPLGDSAIINLSSLFLQDLVIEDGGVDTTGWYMTVRNSTFVNGAYISCWDAEFTVENSDFVDGSVDDIAISGFLCDGRILGNTFSGYGSAIALSDLYDYGTVIADNVVEGGGISISGGYGQNTVSGNYVSSAPGHGISVSRGGFNDLNLTVRDNVLLGNGGDGIHVFDDVANQVTVSANVAVANADLGIEALGVTDGGGNRANGNGNTHQCVGVVCTPPEQCQDGLDNDGDGRTDFRVDGSGDLGCQGPTSVTESPQCQDGLNNDNQAGIDFDGGASVNGGVPSGDPDPQCVGKPWLDREIAACGLGAEMAFVMPLVALAASRRRRAAN